MPTSDKLAAYRSKRDFGATAEPSGDAAVAPVARRRFVIQKHAATRLHYDLRLELDGVFKSWAVTRGPSRDPHDKRLAVEVEDHPLDYGDFEGTIPKGSYGGGTVQLWDRGTWEPEGERTPEEALESGDFKFVLSGRRVKGSYVLVRMKHDRTGGKRINWLLIKHKDGFAREGDDDALLAEDRSVASGRSMATIAEGTGRKPRPFMALAPAGPAAEAAPPAKTRKSRPETPPRASRKPAAKASAVLPEMPGFVAPQLCSSVERPAAGTGWAHEIKFDGYRIQMRVAAGGASLKTRKGLDWTATFGAIAREAAALPDAILDGEVVALDDHGAPDFAALQAALSSEKTGGLVFYAFDLLFEGGDDLRELPLGERKARLQALLSRQPKASVRIRFVEHFESGGEALLKSACRLSLEGIVSKRLDAPYRSGRSESWTKAKCRAGHEVVIGGWTTTGGRFRSLLAGVHRDGHLVHIGRVGTGYGAAAVAALLPRLQAVAADASPFTGRGAPKKAADIHWTRPVLVAEIEFAGWTGDGLIRQAAFKGLREDKPADEVEADTPPPAAVAVPKADARLKTTSAARAEPKAPPPAKPKASGSTPVVMGVVITHPEKAMWPDAGDGGPVSKLDLARYLEAVGPWMMAHVAGRPCSIVRGPNGFAGQQFFQRHAMPGTSSLLDLVTVPGDHKPYLEIDRVEGLAALAQSAALELHPSNCEAKRPEVPGRLVFDLDPGEDVAFATVVAAAKAMRDRLDALGLVSFCKTTGGHGLHVVTPLAVAGSGPVSWPNAKAFAREVCTRMARDEPTRYLVNMSKAARRGRIYLDYLRNDLLSTAVAPLSPRARPGAPVSMPITWAQVKADLDPRRYTVRTVPALLAKTKAWADYEDGRRPLDAAIARLGRAGG